MKPFQLYPKSLAHLACKSPNSYPPPPFGAGAACDLPIVSSSLKNHLPLTIYRACGAGTSAVGAGMARSRGV